MGNKKFWRRIWFYAIIVIFIGVGYWYINSSEPSQYDDFAKCLTEKDVKMYGTNWCHFCEEQKELFGKSFKHIDFVNCDYSMKKCLAAGVKGYPMWEIDGESYSGVQQLARLAELSGCEI